MAIAVEFTTPAETVPARAVLVLDHESEVRPER